MAILFWEMSPSIDEDTRIQVEGVLRASEDIECVLWASAVPRPESTIARSRHSDFYAFAKEATQTLLLRLREGAEPVPPALIEKVLRFHRQNNHQYTYVDGADLGRQLRLEIVDRDALLRAPSPRYYPDGTLALFSLQRSGAYVLDMEDQAFYYRDHFERFYAYPSGLNLEPASRCNLKCRMCCYQSEMYKNAPMEQIPRFMSPELHNKIIDELASFPAPVGIEYCYRGEPLLCPDLFDMLAYASQRGISTALVTNATLLDAEKARCLLDTGLGAITFSVDGATAATYEQIRVGARYGQVVENIRRYLELARDVSNPPISVVKACLQEKNEREIDDLVSLWLPQVDYVTVQNQSIPGDERFKNWFSPRSQKNLRFSRPPCHALWLNMTISTTANMAQCVTFFSEKPEDVIGNVSTSSILDLWRGKEFHRRRDLALRGEFESVPLCRDCDGVSCSAVTLKKEFLDGGSTFVVRCAGYSQYSSATNRRLYPPATTLAGKGEAPLRRRLRGFLGALLGRR